MVQCDSISLPPRSRVTSISASPPSTEADWPGSHVCLVVSGEFLSSIVFPSGACFSRFKNDDVRHWTWASLPLEQSAGGGNGFNRPLWKPAVFRSRPTRVRPPVAVLDYQCSWWQYRAALSSYQTGSLTPAQGLKRHTALHPTAHLWTGVLNPARLRPSCDRSVRHYCTKGF